MRKVLLYSLLLLGGLAGSQFLVGMPPGVRTGISLGTMFCLAFIMIHVGYEFEIDRSQVRHYAWDYVVAATAASLPWVLCALYVALVMSPRETWGSSGLWKEVLLLGLFSSPTSAGVLFSMLAAAGLGATWVFRKARVLAILDDLNTILLLVPLQAFVIGLRWQLIVTAAFIFVLLWVAWRHLNRWAGPVSWPWVMGYAAAIVAVSEMVLLVTKRIDAQLPVHLEVLLPAFALGCVLKPPAGAHPHDDDATEGTEPGPEARREQDVSTWVSALFMVLVGLSMPPISGAGGSTASAALFNFSGISSEVMAAKEAFPGWGIIALHVLAVTVLSNTGKMFPAMCYRREASMRERLALAVGMFPRGEVGAGVLVISLGYGIGGPVLTVAVLSLALNLILTGVFIVIVKKLLAGVSGGSTAMAG